MQIIRSIQNRIYEIRGEKVMLDFDLAALYDTETKVLNQAVKRNIERFPEDFMFRLTTEEWDLIRSQIVTTYPVDSAIQLKVSKNEKNMWSQIVTTSEKRPRKALPYAFTEQGIAMLSGVLNSAKAIQMNIAIMRAFVGIRRVLLLQTDIKEQLLQIHQRMDDHDIQLSSIYEAIENLLDDTISRKKWEERERIGFKK